MNIVSPESQGFDSTRLARVHDVMQRYVDRGQLAGMITLVARRGEVLWLDKAGKMVLEPAKEMAFDALFKIYSMTKPITSAAVMMLYEEGRFHLNTPVAEFIPSFKEMKVYTPRGADYDLVPARSPITIRHLLTHTAGLSYGFEPQSWLDQQYMEQFWKVQDADPNATTESVVDLIAKLPLAYHPGTDWRYSTAIDVLGRLVEVVSGKSFDVFLKERIFDPLGMTDTGFWIPPEKLERLAPVYGPDENGGLKEVDAPAPGLQSFTKPPKWFSGGGGLFSSTEDYFRFAQMILNQGEFGGQRLLGPRTVELMLMNHLPGAKPDDPGSGFGLGGSVVINPAASTGYAPLGSWGWGGAANTWFWIDPREQILGLLMTHYQPSFVLPVDQDFRNMTYQALME